MRLLTRRVGESQISRSIPEASALHNLRVPLALAPFFAGSIGHFFLPTVPLQKIQWIPNLETNKNKNKNRSAAATQNTSINGKLSITMVWSQSCVVETLMKMMTIHVLKAQIQGLNHLRWEQNSWTTYSSKISNMLNKMNEPQNGTMTRTNQIKSHLLFCEAAQEQEWDWSICEARKRQCRWTPSWHWTH